jgi:predicted acetyltransferase
LELEVVQAAYSNKVVLRNLMELYLYDFSEIDGADVDEHGLYGYNRIDHYWTEPGRFPFLIRVDGKWAGFALVSRFSYFKETAESGHAFAEFFVMRRFRRQGVGRRAAFELFRRFPGRWEVAELVVNEGAQAFSRRIISEFSNGRFEEHFLENERWHGPVQVFDSQGNS